MTVSKQAAITALDECIKEIEAFGFLPVYLYIVKLSNVAGV